MKLGFLWTYLAALLLLLGIQAWIWVRPAGVPGSGPIQVELTLAALLVMALALIHLARRARSWAQAQDELMAKRGAQLEQAKQAYQALLDNSGAIIFTLDEQGRYQDMNRFGLRYLGASLDEIIGRYIEEHLDPDSAARLRDLMAQALEQGEARRSHEPLNLAGRDRLLEVYFKLLERGGEKQPQLFCIMRDQTEEKLQEDHLWRAEKLASLGLLAAGVAHQINNPLGILSGFCQLLLDKTPPSAANRRELEIIMEQAGECKNIVQGLLSFTRLSELGAGGPDLASGLHSVAETLRPMLSSKNIELHLDLPPGLPFSQADGGAMQQVFLNLISNAADAMPQGGRLEISAQAKSKPPRQGSMHGTLPDSPTYLEIVFQDNGTGIAPEDLDRIYDPFFSTKPEGQGTGLGLSVAYGIIRENQGTLTCESPVPGRKERTGTRFTIRLPVREGTPRNNATGQANAKDPQNPQSSGQEDA